MSIAKLSLVIPTYNSANYIVRVLDTIIGNLPAEVNEILLMNDGSTDNSEQILKEYGMHNPMVKVYSSRRNLGQANSMMLGVMLASNNLIVSFDDDMQYPITELRKLLEKSNELENFQIIFGVPRRRSQRPQYVKLVRVSYLLFRPFIPWIGIDTPVTSFFLIDRRTMFKKFHPVYPWQWCSEKIDHVGVLHNASVRGNSSYSVTSYIRQFTPILMFVGFGYGSIILSITLLIQVFLLDGFLYCAMTGSAAFLFYLTARWATDLYKYNMLKLLKKNYYELDSTLKKSSCPTTLFP